MPPSRSAARHAARQRDVVGDERLELVAGRRPRAGRRRAGERVRRGRRRAARRAPGRRPGARPSRSTATSVSPGRAASGLRARGQRHGRRCRPGRRAGRDGPAGSSSTAPRRPPDAASSASAGRHADQRDPEAVGQPLGRRDADAQTGECARARSRRRSPSSRERRMFCSPRNRPIDGQQRLAVAVAGRPVETPSEHRRSAARRDDDARRRRVDGEDARGAGRRGRAVMPARRRR